jgi:serine/threonine protein kinase
LNNVDKAPTEADTHRLGEVEDATRVVEELSAIAPPSSLASLTMTPLQTLHLEEVERTRIFCRIALSVAVAVIIATPFINGDPFAELWLIGGLALIVVSTGIFSFLIRTDSGYSERRVFTTACCIIVGVFTGVYYFGVFSPSAVIFPFGIYFFSLAQSFRATLSIYLFTAVGYAVMVALVLSGVWLDRGLVSATGVEPLGLIAMVAIVEAIFAATFVLGRATRRTSLNAVGKHDVAVRRLAQREALLREARFDLEAALHVGGMGRYTDIDLGSFKLGQVIGRGGMGEVYEATHIETGEPAAVKVLQRHLISEPGNVRRFMREARLVAQLDVPNVVRVLEIGDLDALTPFIAMELLRGQDLAERLRKRRQLSLRRTLELVRDVVAGLKGAREAGIVHRDIKPRNLFHAEVDGDRRLWKILDFGVSKLLTAKATMTHGGIVGTPAYMAPEQATGGEVTHLTDLYALGVICYRVLTGRPAFTGTMLPDMIYKVVHQMPPRPSQANPALSVDVDDVLAIALAKSPSDRFESGAALVAALEDVIRERINPAMRERARELQRAYPWASGVASETSSTPADESTVRTV